MDEHGQIGPEKGQYPADVRAVARLLRDNGHVLVKLSDRMTVYWLHIALREGIPTMLDNGYVIGGVPSDAGYVLVSCVEHGSYWFQLGGFNAPEYVATKLDLAGVVDGEIISEFLARLAAAHEGERRILPVALA